ncbi:hypothetical protein [Accumulibacter sp.]|uniref:hypothetical protein n=1 Tax=Accumulibacter sp. TaxID=2053492 RepID=UPI0028C4BA34|nr:hypothetical protein [Accumulibacter sp.]
MKLKMVTGLVGLVMLIGFLAPPAIKLEKVSLIVVVLIGVGMAVYEYIENLRDKDD